MPPDIFCWLEGPISLVHTFNIKRASHTRQRHDTHHRPNPHVCEGPPTLNAACRCRACPLVVLAWTAAIVAGVRIATKDFGGEITTHPFSPSKMERCRTKAEEQRSNSPITSDNFKGHPIHEPLPLIGVTKSTAAAYVVPPCRCSGETHQNNPS